MTTLHPAATDLVRRHFDRQLDAGLAEGYGPCDSPMWMSSLDIRTGRYPEPDERPPHIPKRCYRYIDAPRGCSLYWDQPQIAAAHALTRVTGDDRYARAADDYTRTYLQRATAGNHVILWGNHYYYDAFDDAVVRFVGSERPVPCDFATEAGEYHEMRPLTPAWETLWALEPERVERAIRAAVAGHLADGDADAGAGVFNRHADRRVGCAFLEAGGVLVETLAWLYAKTLDAELLATARRIARYSYEQRHDDTGLLSNNPTVTRWDRHTATTELGLWAGCLLRAADMIDDAHRPLRDELARIADDAMRCYLRFAYDPEAEHFYGRLNLADGSPILGPTETPYEPGDYTALWRPQFPAHDYPMPLGEAALRLARRTDEPIYEQTCRRLAALIARELPARPSEHQQGGYAEHYGRCLHFALGCADTFGDASFTKLAHRLADEAIDVLWAREHAMFRTHGGEDRYDAVDALGFLLLALVWLDTGSEPDGLGLAW